MDSVASSPASSSSRVARNLFHMSPVKHYSYGTDSDECASPLQLSSPDDSPATKGSPRNAHRTRKSPNNSPAIQLSPILRTNRLGNATPERKSPPESKAPRRSPRTADISTAALMTPFKCLGKQAKIIIEESPDVDTMIPQNRKAPSKQASVSQFYSPSSGISVGSFYSAGKPKARLSLFSSSTFAVPKATKRSRSATTDNRSKVKRVKVDVPRLGNCRSGIAKRKKRVDAAKVPAVKKIVLILPQDRIDQAEMDEVMAEINRPKLAPLELNSIRKRVRPVEKPVKVAMKSPEPDPKKKFFKTNRTMEVNRTATVTLDKSMRFEVSNGNITRQKPVAARIRAPRILFAPLPSEQEVSAATAKVQLKVNRIIDSLAETAEETDESAINAGPVPVAMSAHSPTKVAVTPSPISSPDTKMAAITSSTSKMALSEPPLGEPEDQGLFPLFYKKFSPPRAQSPRGQRATKRYHNVALQPDQMQIDAGQRRFGHTLCAGCNLLYQMGEPEEERRHREYHDRHHVIKFPGWKQERLANVYEDGAARVIAVMPSDPKPRWRKVSQVMEAIDDEIGSVSEQDLQQLPNVRVLLYVAEGRAVGCVVGHALRSANRLLPRLDGVQCCSELSEPVVMGIARIWVAQDWRKRKVASRLVDCLRSTFVYGAVLSMNDFAFSVPTEAGEAFARKYTSAEDFLVYM